MDRIYLNSETYLLLGSKLLGRTFLFQFRGFNKFSEVTSLLTPGVSSVLSYWSQDGELFLALSSTKAGHTRILKAVIDGPKPNQHRFNSLKQFLTINRT